MWEYVQGVYLLHFSSNVHHARHYIGWSSNIAARLQKHQTGKAQTALTVTACARGVQMSVVRVWEGEDKNFERRLKNRKKAWQMCPICNPNGWKTQGVYKNESHPLQDV